MKSDVASHRITHENARAQPQGTDLVSIDRVKVDFVNGQGGVGFVFVAFDANVLEKKVRV